ncbi:MAG: hypothetical protein M3Y42_05340 [Actinomycetota bacterium]|nr:hypothetical protein [Actinomycetota bacterium]MDQ2956371.1 hypothetical protein [Actinomycetota bacterium]
MTEAQKPATEATTEDRPAAPKSGVPGPLFSGPAVPTQAVRANGRPVTPAFGNKVDGQPVAPADPPQAAPLPIKDQYAAALAQQMAGQSATAMHDQEWIAAGLSPHDGYLIEQCKRNGLTPQDLRIRVDGRTLASRLKNGESVSSVKSRIT